jgi:Uri superfamily endonuclease
VGRLGHFRFAAGYYLYIGSAFGSGGLRARLAYHQQRTKPHPHWHVDYLREHSHLVETWSIASSIRLERVLASALAAAPELTVPVPRFGAGDAPSSSHLFYSPRRPPTRALTSAIMAGAESGEQYGGQLTIEIHTYDEAEPQPG